MAEPHYRALIVGGGSGIGFASARAMVRTGAEVWIAGRTAEKLNAAQSRVSHDGTGGILHTLPFDMTDQAAVDAAVAALPEDGLDALVITASSAVHGPFETLDIEAARGMFDSKFWGPYRVAKTILLKLRDGGSITVFSGVLSRRPGLNCSGLGAVNSAVEGLARGLALELGPRIRVNCISPGMVRSEVYDKMPEDRREAMFRDTGASLPAGRVGEVEEIAAAVLFAAMNPYFTGQVLDVDGGHMVRQYATR